MNFSTRAPLPKAFHHKQPFNPDGDVYSHAFTRPMKNQPLPRWDKFTREALQNSWDARASEYTTASIKFRADYLSLTSSQVSCLRENVLGGNFDGIPDLQEHLFADRLGMLVISDRGTNGLRGPTSAAVSAGEHKDFTAFVRNFGRSDTKKLRGGTFGVGKAVFFVASEVSTILVYTRTHDENGNPSSRFIAMASGNDFQSDGVQYTGRHWWGVRAIGGAGRSSIEYAEPFTGEQADLFAQVFGMDRDFTDSAPTGTSIAVLSPNIDDSLGDEPSPLLLMQTISSALTRWAWPHMLCAEGAAPSIDFEVTINEQIVPVLSPEEDPALRRFSDAYRAALDAPSTPKNEWKMTFLQRVAEVWSLSPAKRLGTLVALNMPSEISSSQTTIGHDISNHIALIREPRMVVQYYRGPVQRSEQPYCGVFISSLEADPVFARSEPEAHHEWNPMALQEERQILAKFWGSQARTNPVKVFYDKVDSLLATSGEKNQLGGDQKHFQSLTALSDRFGSIISSAKSGTSLSVSQSKAPRSGRSVKSHTSPIATQEHIGLTALDQNFVLSRFRITITLPPEHRQWTAKLSPIVALDEGTLPPSDLADAGFFTPSIVCVMADGRDVCHGAGPIPQFDLTLTKPESVVEVHVRQPRIFAVFLDVHFDEDVSMRDSNNG